MRCGDTKGFTLLETVVALAIVSIAGIAALSALGAELRSAERTHRALEAEALAQDRLARLSLAGAEDLELLPDSLRHGTIAPPFGAYSWESTSREVPGDVGLFDVTVVVRWSDGSYEVRSRLYRQRRSSAS